MDVDSSAKKKFVHILKHVPYLVTQDHMCNVRRRSKFFVIVKKNRKLFLVHLRVKKIFVVIKFAASN
jgi:hypothetical protein